MSINQAHSNKKIGEWLLHLGLLTKRQLESAMESQTANPELKIGEILTRKGYITQKELDETLAIQEVLKGRTALKDYPSPPRFRTLLPEDFCLQYEVLPLAPVAMRLLVATSNARNFQALDKITLHTGLIVISIEVPREELLHALAKQFNRDPMLATQDPVAVLTVPPPAPEHPPLPPARQPTEAANDALIVDLVNSVIVEALQYNATEIHLTPYESVLEIRCRCDGIMRKILEVPKKLENLVLKRFKQIAGLSGSEQRWLEQAPLTVKGEGVTLRTASASSLWGERLFVQIVRANQEIKSLAELGMEPEDLLEYKQMIRGMRGVVLVVGPRSNGKSTTLYATVGFLDKLNNHVVMIEQFIRVPIPGVTQLQLNPRQGFTLEAAIDVALEQHPDILVIEEITTPGEVEAVIRAALTGMQVIAAMNVTNVSAGLARLLQMGIAPHLLDHCLRGAIAQRLIRRNCPYCSVEYTATHEERVFLGVAPTAPLTLVRGGGCEQCDQTGYLGQIGLFEVVHLNGPVNGQGASLASAEWMTQLGTNNHINDAKRKLASGLTSIYEITRKLGDSLASERMSI